MRGVSRAFRSGDAITHALSGICLEIKRGDYVAIAGPSGCGKSTLLSLIGLLDSPDDGAYLLRGRSVANLSRAERSRVRSQEIGFIFQAFNLIGDLTVAENVELPLTYQRGRARCAPGERRRRVMMLLECVGMAPHARQFPSQLSGGGQQRVAIARALAAQPMLLLADEPTGNLDSANAEGVMGLLRELHKGGATICIVTHDPRFAKHAERTVHMKDGRIVHETHL